MINGVLITNGSPDGTRGYHSASTWAVATARRIAPTDVLEKKVENNEPGAGEKLIEAERLRMRFADILVKHHDGVQKREQDAIRKPTGHERLQRIAVHTDDEDREAIQEALAATFDCVAAAKGTMWEAHFNVPEVQAEVANTIKMDIISVKQVERHRHFDNNPQLVRPVVDPGRLQLLQGEVK